MSSIRNTVLNAVVAVLPVAIVYFSGWAFLSSYLAEFGIDATQANVPTATVLTYAVKPLLSDEFGVWLFASSALYLLHWQKLPRPWSFPIAFLVAVVCLITLLLFLSLAAKQSAQSQADLVWEGQKSITMAELKTDPKPSTRRIEYDRCIEEKRVRQIIGLGDTLYLLCRSKPEPRGHGIMFVINKDREIIYSAERKHNVDED